MPSRVLLLGRARDPHVAAVRREIRRRARDALVFDPSDYPAKAAVSLRIGPRTEMSAEGTPVDLADIGVGWIAAPWTAGKATGVAPAARRFAHAAAQQGLESLLRACPFPWVNDPDAALRADDKMLQLAAARRAGFLVPDTLYTNDPGAVRAFARRHAKLVAKSHSGSRGLPDDKRILTNVLGPDDLARLDDVRPAPVCFQAYVSKASELRVTVIGPRVHAVRIHSQAKARTKIDWRRYGPGLDYSKAALPRAVRDRCLKVARALGLDYGGIDLVERPDGELVFLEINTLPAWLWLEDATGEPITASLVDHLESRIQAERRPEAARGGPAQSVR